MSKTALTGAQIRELLPHRYPMLLIDRVLEVTATHAVAEKLVSASDPFLDGHFPTQPVMPGVLILEALGQTAGLAIYWNNPDYRGRGIALAGANNVRFRKPVFPGDVLQLNVSFSKTRGRVLRAEGVATVQGETAAEGQLMAVIVDWEKIA